MGRREHPPHCSPPFPRTDQKHYLSPHGGWAVANGSVRLQARADGLVRQGFAGLHSYGPAAHDDDLGAETLSHRAIQIRLRPGRLERILDEHGASTVHGQVRRFDGLHPFSLHGSHQSRAGHHPHANRQHGIRTPLHRVMGQLWAGFAESKPANLRRLGGGTIQQRASPGHQRPALVQRISFRRTCRSLVPQPRRPDSVH